ncbi:MAG: SIR2 family protein [Campylobacter sp.]
MTTNYDLILENLLPENSISLGPNDILTSSKYKIPIYHLHGIRTDPSSIIITKEDYTKLFRPNKYRLQKLSLLFKESTTLIINVLTALDWSENVYQNNKIYYPNGIIQLLYKRNNPNPEPIIQENGIITLEIDSILDIMKELSDFIERNKEKYNKEKLEINNFRSELINADDNFIEDFINNENKRIEHIDKVQNNSEFVVEAFLQLLTKVFDRCWSRALLKNNFKPYDEILVIVLDILLKMPFNKMSPALFGSIAHNLGRVSRYIGCERGQSYAANNTWIRYKNYIQNTTKTELLLYYKQSPYEYYMQKLLE